MSFGSSSTGGDGPLEQFVDLGLGQGRRVAGAAVQRDLSGVDVGPQRRRHVVEAVHAAVRAARVPAARVGVAAGVEAQGLAIKQVIAPAVAGTH